MKLKKLTTKTALITLGVVVGLSVGGFGISQSEAAMDWLGLEQKLANHDETLDNHEDRLDNTEADVSDLQANTNTAPSQDKVIVREVVTPNTTPAPEDTRVKVVSWGMIQHSSSTSCTYNYSDGTSTYFVWRTANQDGTFTYNGTCDESVIGKIK